MANVEYWYNDQTLIHAEIEEHDDSFDHQLGHERRYTYEVGHISVIIYNFGVDTDVTKGLSEGLLEGLKEWALERWLNTSAET